MLRIFTRNWKLTLLIIVSLLAILFLWLFLRSWWNGIEILERVGTLQNSNLHKKAVCDYWQTTDSIPDPQKPPENIIIWIEPKEDKLISSVNQLTATGEKVKIKYQRDVVHRFWACTPSDYKLISVERLQTPSSLPTLPTTKPISEIGKPVLPLEKPPAMTDKPVLH